jgi:hypothetical protein
MNSETDGGKVSGEAQNTLNLNSSARGKMARH